MKETTRRRILQNIALFMMLLIFMLPVCFAAQINSFYIYGKDKVVINDNGFITSPDKLIFNLTVTYTDGPVMDSSQVKLLEAPTASFDCTLLVNTTNRYSCINEQPESVYPEMTYTARVYAGSSAVSAPKSARYYVDSKAPTGVFEVKQIENTTVAVFNIEDKTDSAPTLCSGIRSVEFLEAGAVLGKTEFNTTACIQQGQNNLSMPAQGTIRKEICMRAIDGVGNYEDACQDIVVDRQAPEIKDLQLVYSNGAPLKTVNGKIQVQARVRFTLEDDFELSNESFALDLTDMNERPDMQNALKAVQVQLVGRESERKAFYETIGFPLYVTTQRDVVAKINVADKAGNILTADVPYSLKFDNAPPVVTRIYSQAVDSRGMSWVKEDENSLYVEIQEPGAGFENKNVILDFTSFGGQETTTGELATNLYPNNCVQDGSIWTCEWLDIEVLSAREKQPLSLTILYGSADDAGNVLEGRTSTTMYYDNTEPVPFYFNITPVPGENQLPIQYLVSGNAAFIRTYVADVTPVSAKADLSMLLADPVVEDFEGLCQEFVSDDPDYVKIVTDAAAEADVSDKTIYECMWETGTIVNGYLEVPLYFTYEDLLGLNETSEEETAILRIGNETIEGGYWEVKSYDLKSSGSRTYNEMLSPSIGMDRGWWMVQQFQFYNKVEIKPHGRNVNLLLVEFDPLYCVGAPGTEYLMTDEVTNYPSIQMMGFDQSADERLDVVTFVTNPSSFPVLLSEDERQVIKSINFTCPLFIVSLVKEHDKSVEVGPLEQYNLTFIIPVFNNPLGQNLNNVKEEIKRLEKIINSDAWNWLGKVETVFHYAEKACAVLGILYGVVSLYAGLTDTLKAIAKLPILTAEVEPTADNMADQVTQGDKYLEGIFGDLYPLFCGMLVQCRLVREKELDLSGTCDGWCAFKKKWQQINSWYVTVFWGDYLKMDKLSGTDYLAKQTANPTTGQKEDTVKPIFNQESFDPKRSIVSSVLTACLPGIIFNLQKIRAMYCAHLKCLKVDVPNGFVTLTDCEKRFHEDRCTLAVGQAFNSIPLVQYAQQISELLKDIIRDWKTLIPMAVDYGLQALCSRGKIVTFCAIGIVAKYGAEFIAQVTGIINTFTKDFGSVPPDYCEAILKISTDAPSAAPATEEES